MPKPAQSNGYSSTVRGWLIVDEQRLPLSQVGPDFCILQTETNIQATDAELVIEVDQTQRSQKVRIVNGFNGELSRLRFTLSQ